MAKKSLIKDRATGETTYPVTTSECILDFKEAIKPTVFIYDDIDEVPLDYHIIVLNLTSITTTTAQINLDTTNYIRNTPVRFIIKTGNNALNIDFRTSTNLLHLVDAFDNIEASQISIPAKTIGEFIIIDVDADNVRVVTSINASL